MHPLHHLEHSSEQDPLTTAQLTLSTYQDPFFTPDWPPQRVPTQAHPLYASSDQENTTLEGQQQQIQLPGPHRATATAHLLQDLHIPQLHATFARTDAHTKAGRTTIQNLTGQQQPNDLPPPAVRRLILINPDWEKLYTTLRNISWDVLN